MRPLALLSLLVCSFSAFAACTFDLLPPVAYPTGQDTRNFVVARLNGDDLYDVALRVEQTDEMVVMLGTPGGRFGEPTEFSTGRKTMYDVESGDFNDDGIVDLVTTNGWLENFTVLPAVLLMLGKGDGTFHPATATNVYQNPQHLSLADFDDDGKLDVATTKTSGFELLLGQGDGTLVSKSGMFLLPETGANSLTEGITHGHLDRDGHLDVAVASHGGIHTFYGVGDGTFTRGPVLPLVGGFVPFRVTSGDYDRDGDADLAYGQYHSGMPGAREMIVYLSNGNARTFQEPDGYGTLPGGSFDAQSSDIDGDGDIDVLLACLSNTIVLFNDGNGAFSEQESYGDDSFESKAVDIDGDGGLDLVASGFYFDSVTVSRNFCSRVGINLTSSPNPSTVNTHATFTATAVPPAAPVPTGTLTLKRGNNVLASGDLATSLTVSATLNTLPVGSYTITAIYSGDTHFKAETKKIKHVVELPPFGTPTNLSASSAGGAVTVTWTGTKGVEHYEVWRSGAGAAFALLGTTTNQTFLDSTASPSAGWLYKVRGVPTGGGSPSAFSNADLASTFTFTDETLTAGVTKIRRAHMTELRNAVDSARVAAGLGVAVWTDPTPGRVRTIHFTELRTALEQARAAAGMPTATFDIPVTGTKIRALHVFQLRTALR